MADKADADVPKLKKRRIIVRIRTSKDMVCAAALNMKRGNDNRHTRELRVVSSLDLRLEFATSELSDRDCRSREEH